ncbi:MAG: type II secretion system minor pseudopilin GspK [Pseudomonadota bacterium]|nr:type II secretion system minor pseudopilin GspK [Pseudomonadota bacterium]
MMGAFSLPAAPRRQRGIAVVMAILIAALAASVASFMMWQQQVWARQVENLTSLAQASAVSQAALEWTRMILAEDLKSGDIDHPGEIWATVVPALPVEGGSIALALTDQQGLFNLNNLVRNEKPSEGDIEAFQRLLIALDLKPDLANAVVDWIDLDSEAMSSGGAEDLDYLAMQPPYRAANQPLLDVNGLIRVRGFDAEAVARLRPFVTALPTPTPLNVNTAPPQVLAAVFEGLTVDAAKSLVVREGKYYKDKTEFRDRMPKGGATLSDQTFGLGSQYFLVTGIMRFGRVQIINRALLARSGDRINVIWRKHGDS